MKPHEPELVLEIDLGQYGTRAFLVIDRLVGGTSWGGLRIVPDPSLSETIASARTMTWKCAFVGIGRGGAKLALQLLEEHDHRRKEIVTHLGSRLSHFLRACKWIPGIDMGCNREDIENLYRGAGIGRSLSTWKDLAPLYTAWTVYLSTIAASEMLGKPIRGMAFVIQGLGRVGMEYCRMMKEAGAILVAASTRKGALYSPNGLDIDEVLRLRAERGDGFVLNYPKAEMIDPEELLQLDVDIVVPCARCWAINERNSSAIKGTIIACAANVAMDISIERQLHKKGKIVITDFVANCGGVFGSILERYLQPSAIYHLLETDYFRKVTKLLQQSLDEERSVADIAIEESIEKLNRLDSLRERALQSIGKRILPFIPNVIRQPALLRYCSMRFFTS